MKINDLTEESIKELPRGTYAIFDSRDELCDIIYYTAHGDRPFDLSDTQMSESLSEFKRQCKDCEMFPIEQIKKPK